MIRYKEKSWISSLKADRKMTMSEMSKLGFATSHRNDGLSSHNSGHDCKICMGPQDMSRYQLLISNVPKEVTKVTTATALCVSGKTGWVPTFVLVQRAEQEMAEDEQ